MKQHAGATMEKVVRRSGISIAELARRVAINRRSIYNWFEQETLSIDTIVKVGNALNYDFSADFQQLLPNRCFQSFTGPAPSAYQETDHSLEFWKDKYILLLEKYNELLAEGQKPVVNAVSEENAA